MLFHSFYPVATMLPIWLALMWARVRIWSYNVIGLQRPVAIRADGRVSRIESEVEKSVSMLDTQIVILGLACIILSGFLVGREPGTLWPNPVWAVVFSLSGLGIAYLTVRLTRLARQQKH